MLHLLKSFSVEFIWLLPPRECTFFHYIMAMAVQVKEPFKQTRRGAWIRTTTCDPKSLTPIFLVLRFNAVTEAEVQDTNISIRRNSQWKCPCEEGPGLGPLLLKKEVLLLANAQIRDFVFYHPTPNKRKEASWKLVEELISLHVYVKRVFDFWMLHKPCYALRYLRSKTAGPLPEALIGISLAGADTIS